MEKIFQLRSAFENYVDQLIPFYQVLSTFVKIQWRGKNKRIYLYELQDDFTYFIAEGQVELHVPIEAGVYRLHRVYGQGQAMCAILNNFPPHGFLKIRVKTKFFKLPKYRDEEIRKALPKVEELLGAIHENNNRQDWKWQQFQEMTFREVKEELQAMFPGKKFKNSDLKAMFNIPHSTFYRKLRQIPPPYTNPNFSLNF